MTTNGDAGRLKRMGYFAILMSTVTPQAVAAQDMSPSTAASTPDASNDQKEIVVTGIRSSIDKALKIKRDAINVVDSVVAEDIGKLPDQNVAEALQRIPGIAISRERGEGRNISVRGMDSSFNVTTLNGRRLATENPGREFSYDVLASEVVSRIDVNKTPEAHLYEGGIGAVVDIRTLRPFDVPGTTLQASAYAVNDGLASKTNLRASAVVSKTFADDTFGVLLSLNYNKRNLREDSVTISQYVSPFDVDLFKDGTVEYPGTTIPRNIQFRVTDEKRERIGGTAAIQWKPSPNLQVTFDGVYSRYNTDNYTSSYGVPLDVGQAGAQGTYYEHPAYVAAQVDSNNNLVYARFGDDGTGTLRNPWAFVETVAIRNRESRKRSWEAST